MQRILRWVVLMFVAVFAALAIWLSFPLGPLDGAQAALTSSATVSVDQEPWLTFRPDRASTTGLIFYPGGRVHPESYAPAARAFAEEGYLTVVVAMPLNLAVLSPDRANKVIEAHPEIETWVIGGHSLGGAMAAGFANAHRDRIQGLVLWAAYPGANTDLRNAETKVLVAYGTKDCIATPDEVLDGAMRLPGDTMLLPIEGGNHMQFGWYGGQPGACSAAISLEEQQALAIKATVDLLNSVDTPSRLVENLLKLRFGRAREQRQ